jgi:hypothetical protein
MNIAFEQVKNPATKAFSQLATWYFNLLLLRAKERNNGAF